MAKKLSANAIEKVLVELGANINLKAKEALGKGAETILTDAKTQINSISNTLANSGKIKFNKIGTVARVVFDAKNGDYGYAKIVEFRKGHEHPFLYSAYDANRDKVKESIIEAIRQAVKEK